MSYLRDSGELGDMRMHVITDYSLDIADVCVRYTTLKGPPGSRLRALPLRAMRCDAMRCDATKVKQRLPPGLQVNVDTGSVLCALSIKLMCMSPCNRYVRPAAFVNVRTECPRTTAPA
jgi:hypothetical protein